MQTQERVQIGQKSITTILQALTKLENDITQNIRKDSIPHLYEDVKKIN